MVGSSTDDADADPIPFIPASKTVDDIDAISRIQVVDSSLAIDFPSLLNPDVRKGLKMNGHVLHFPIRDKEWGYMRGFLPRLRNLRCSRIIILPKHCHGEISLGPRECKKGVVRTWGDMGLLTGPHHTSFSELSSLTILLSNGERPVFAPE